MSSTVEHMFAISAASKLLHVPSHMQKLSFACHSHTRSPVLCVQVTRLCSLHTCGGFDPPTPRTAGSGAPLQCRLVAHIGGGAGTPADATGTAAGCSSGHRCGCHFCMPYLAPPHGHPCNATGCCHTAAVTHDCSCHMQCIRMLICHIEA